MCSNKPQFVSLSYFFLSTSVPKELSYPATAPALNIKPGNDYSGVNVSAVGPKVETTFEVRTVRTMPFLECYLYLRISIRKRVKEYC